MHHLVTLTSPTSDEPKTPQKAPPSMAQEFHIANEQFASEFSEGNESLMAD